MKKNHRNTIPTDFNTGSILEYVIVSFFRFLKRVFRPENDVPR